jgi:hypothetical protein
MAIGVQSNFVIYQDELQTGLMRPRQAEFPGKPQRSCAFACTPNTTPRSSDARRIRLASPRLAHTPGSET